MILQQQIKIHWIINALHYLQFPLLSVSFSFPFFISQCYVCQFSFVCLLTFSFVSLLPFKFHLCFLFCFFFPNSMSLMLCFFFFLFFFFFTFCCRLYTQFVASKCYYSLSRIPSAHGCWSTPHVLQCPDPSLLGGGVDVAPSAILMHPCNPSFCFLIFFLAPTCSCIHTIYASKHALWDMLAQSDVQ